MTLHIRDFRQSDAAGLSGLCSDSRVIGCLPASGAETRFLCGLRCDRLAGALWYGIDGETGLIHAAAVKGGPGWPSDVPELVAEAGLCLASSGAATIEICARPADSELLSALTSMGFSPDERAGRMRRMVLASSTA